MKFNNILHLNILRNINFDFSYLIIIALFTNAGDLSEIIALCRKYKSKVKQSDVRKKKIYVF